ncbi:MULTISPECIES: UdgX family uracil-DNA binding protein [Lysobacter]|uniref:Type-4 uracil-DNA glycosylase n=1 Tax=Lysobacter firmicutimachus TaxID=1792846 RepID=A0ABU8D2H8_9GAMM|nr:UdgX family uracil-DNA binding protein [Lysobacter antibioticus]
MNAPDDGGPRRAPARRAHLSTAVPFAKPVGEIPKGSLRHLRDEAEHCRRCPLWRGATQTVFGRGSSDARAMLIGEQPGDREDLRGEPFVGPAGRLLDKALADAGLARSALYLTNAVKHFKYEQRGPDRLHTRASAREQEACRVWLAAEWLRVRPRLAVALGAMAAQTLFGSGFRLSRERGQWLELEPHCRALATWHPSSVLRTPGTGRQRRYAELVEDLGRLAEALREPEP